MVVCALCVLQEAELRTGRRSEGIFFAAISFGRKMVTSLGTWGGGVVLITSGFSKAVPKGTPPDKADPEAVTRILETLPVLSACNDLRALTDLEAANRTMFQGLQGIHRLVDYMRPRGQNAPYATIVARTLPCVHTRSLTRRSNSQLPPCSPT